MDFHPHLFIHLEKVAVTLFDHMLPEPGNGFLEIKENGKAGRANAETASQRSLAAREATSRVRGSRKQDTFFEEIITVFFRNIVLLLTFRGGFLSIFFFLRNPDTAVIPEAFAHQCKFDW